jgi:hypothetical protein
MKTAYRLCGKISQFLHFLFQTVRYSARICAGKKKITVIYNISDYLLLVSKSKPFKTVTALTPGKEFLVMLDKGL